MVKTSFFLLLSSMVFSSPGAADDPFGVELGEKLFLEDRFSQSFARENFGNVNQILVEGDPILEFLETPLGPQAHPQRGRQVSCSSCHLVDQAMNQKKQFVFTYNDFSPLTKIPLRDDNQTRTTRNSMNMVQSAIKKGTPLHWDGEFFSAQDLTCASLVGRNMGWLPSEAGQARRHIVQVLRGDDGTYPSDSDIGEAYPEAFSKLGYDFSQMSENEILQATCKTIALYIEDLDFSRDQSGGYSQSAYDKFLKKNGLRRKLKAGETSRQYLQYLRDHLNFTPNWKWIPAERLKYHDHPALFGEKELQGMKLFFGKAQCISCHTPPEFTNFSFHATGISQLEYDKIHGHGAFSRLSIPSWKEREEQANRFFVATEEHPEWRGVFRKRPAAENPQFVDLGVWNMLGHPDKGSIQQNLKDTICRLEKKTNCQWSQQEYLERSVAMFRTPTLRGLGQSKPYFHNGSAGDLRDALKQYMVASALSKHEKLVNSDPMLKVMNIEPGEIEFLEAFLRTLDEDYD